MKEFVIKEDNFKFRFLDEVPIADANQCILLYREGSGNKGALVIDSYTRPNILDMRRGKFNKIVYLSTEKKSVNYSFQVAMRDNKFNFDVKVALDYSLKKAANYYFENSENRDSIYEEVDRIISSCNRSYRIDQEIDLKKYLQEELKKGLDQYYTLYFHAINVSVEGDSDAQQILRSGRKKDVEKAKYGDETEIKQFKIKKDEEIKAYNIQQIVKLASQFGALGPIMNAYSKGEISDEKFYEYIEKNKVNELNNLKVAIENDLLSTDDIQDKAIEILNNSIGGPGQMAQIETKPADDENETDESVVVDYSPEDEDFI